MQKIKFKDFIDYDKRIGKMLIFGDEGCGKTLLMTRIAIGKMLYGMYDCWKSYELVEKYNLLGFKFNTNYEHLCFANYDINCLNTSFPNRRVYAINPFRLGLYRSDYETDILPPFSLVCITEGVNYFNSYLFDKFPTSFISYIKTLRQAKIDLCIDTQYYNDICTRVRNITNRFIKLFKPCEEIKNLRGEVVGHKLFVKEFSSSADVDLYENSRKLNNCKEYILIIDDMCCYSNFDSSMCQYLHLKNRYTSKYKLEHFSKIDSIPDIVNGNYIDFDIPTGFFINKKEITKVKSNNNDDNVCDDCDF